MGTNVKWGKSRSFHRLWEHQKGRCFYCDFEMVNTSYQRKTNKKGYTRDHFLPVAAGHTHKGNNVLSCPHCNLNKADFEPTYLECVAFIDLWAKVGIDTLVINPIWDEFIEQMATIRWFSKLVGLYCP